MTLNENKLPKDVNGKTFIPSRPMAVAKLAERLFPTQEIHGPYQNNFY